MGWEGMEMALGSVEAKVINKADAVDGWMIRDVME
jgi:hypothetical protein